MLCYLRRVKTSYRSKSIVNIVALNSLAAFLKFFPPWFAGSNIQHPWLLYACTDVPTHSASHACLTTCNMFVRSYSPCLSGFPFARQNWICSLDDYRVMNDPLITSIAILVNPTFALIHSSRLITILSHGGTVGLRLISVSLKLTNSQKINALVINVC